MATYRIRPSKPAAILSAVVGVVILVVGLVNVTGRTGNVWFSVLWAVAVLLIIGFNLWSAFSPRGGTPLFGQVVTRDEDEPDRGPDRGPHR